MRLANTFLAGWLLLLVSLVSTESVFAAAGSGKPEVPAKHLFRSAQAMQAQKRFAESTVVLGRLLKQDPVYFEPEAGSGWYLLAQAVLHLQGGERAWLILRSGQRRLTQAGIFDPYLTEKLIRWTARLGKEELYEHVCLAYDSLLARLDSGEADSLAARLTGENLFLLPDSLQQRLQKTSSRGTLFPGETLVRYWHRHDPTPVTAVNERLLEHLQRVETARERYPAPNPRGFDDRGVLFVRLGRPDKVRSSRYFEIKRIDHHPHEVWFYPTISRTLDFLFVDFEQGGGYEEAMLDVLVDDVRQKITPRFRSQVLSGIKAFPVKMQTARFRDEEGGTRMEIYVGVQKKQLLTNRVKPLLPQDSLFVRVRTTLPDGLYRPTKTYEQTVAVFSGNDQLGDGFVTGAVSVKLTRAQSWVAGQVESWLRPAGTRFRKTSNADLHTPWQKEYPHRERALKMATFRTLPQALLRSPGDSLLMSDLQLSDKIRPETEHPTPHKGNLYVAAYPFRHFHKSAPVYLYFEAYGLRSTLNGETHYRIEYRVDVIRPHKSLWSRLTGSGKSRLRQSLSVTSEKRDRTPNVKEWIGLDLHELPAGKVRLTIKTTDFIAAAEFVRHVDFELLN